MCALVTGVQTCALPICPRSSVHWVTLSVGRMFRICSSFSATVESPQRVRERTSEGGSRVMVPSIFAWGHIVPAVAPHGPGLPDIALHSPGVLRPENGRFPPFCRPLRDHLTRTTGAHKRLPWFTTEEN